MKNEGHHQKPKFRLDADTHLRHCPFCGRTKEKLRLLNDGIVPSYWVECPCGAMVSGANIAHFNKRIDNHRAAAQSALDAWNKRIPSGPTS